MILVSQAKKRRQARPRSPRNPAGKGANGAVGSSPGGWSPPSGTWVSDGLPSVPAPEAPPPCPPPPRRTVAGVAGRRFPVFAHRQVEAGSARALRRLSAAPRTAPLAVGLASRPRVSSSPGHTRRRQDLRMDLASLMRLRRGVGLRWATWDALPRRGGGQALPRHEKGEATHGRPHPPPALWRRPSPGSRPAPRQRWPKRRPRPFRSLAKARRTAPARTPNSSPPSFPQARCTAAARARARRGSGGTGGSVSRKAARRTAAAGSRSRGWANGARAVNLRRPPGAAPVGQGPRQTRGDHSPRAQPARRRRHGAPQREGSRRP
jgi:hypothetical protein